MMIMCKYYRWKLPQQKNEEWEVQAERKQNETKPFPSRSIWTLAIRQTKKSSMPMQTKPNQTKSSRCESSWLAAANQGEIQSRPTPLAILLTCFCSLLISIIYMQMLNRMIDPRMVAVAGWQVEGVRGRGQYCHCEMCRDVSKFDLTAESSDSGVFPSVKLAAIRRVRRVVQGGGCAGGGSNNNNNSVTIQKKNTFSWQHTVYFKKGARNGLIFYSYVMWYIRNWKW